MKWKTFRENRQTKAYVAVCVLKALNRVNVSILEVKVFTLQIEHSMCSHYLSQFPPQKVSNSTQ